MRTGPPSILEKIAGFFLPPACREEVLGDLYERTTSSAGYVLDAILTVPMVIASRIRRTSDPVVLLIEGFVFYSAYLGAAWFHDLDFLYGNHGLLRLAVPPVMILLGQLFFDAYSVPGRTSRLGPVHGLYVGLLAALFSQAIFAAGNLPLFVPRWVMLSGSTISMLLGSGLRRLFPPLPGRPLGAGGPAEWLKQDVEATLAHNVVSTVKSMALIAAIGILGGLTGGARFGVGGILISTLLLIARELRRRA